MRERIKQMLLQTALQNPGVDGRVKMAAGIVYKKTLIASGINSYKTHPVMCCANGYRDGQHYLHAEIDAINKALKLISKKQLAKCDMYVVRLKRTKPGGTVYVEGLAKPCVGCMQVIESYNINNVYWTEDEHICIA